MENHVFETHLHVNVDFAGNLIKISMYNSSGRLAIGFAASVLCRNRLLSFNNRDPLPPPNIVQINFFFFHNMFKKEP